ncbi:hypothetical protein TREPR_1060 [Treponema primitia ZAS-2]|uniref:Uncharacterized protein n=1 Tax=Treponema primitia (strain ATCC BAA-887 / DSM 12427 / ZAS-2) TaxID=545694 RepID=F5YHL9_TREPZ|nr:hypothetical protein TREPR_1060 [Treponema primitia ZAS-2]
MRIWEDSIRGRGSLSNFFAFQKNIHDTLSHNTRYLKGI